MPLISLFRTQMCQVKCSVPHSYSISRSSLFFFVKSHAQKWKKSPPLSLSLSLSLFLSLLLAYFAIFPISPFLLSFQQQSVCQTFHTSNWFRDITFLTLFVWRMFSTLLWQWIMLTVCWQICSLAGFHSYLLSNSNNSIRPSDQAIEAWTRKPRDTLMSSELTETSLGIKQKAKDSCFIQGESYLNLRIMLRAN